LDQLVGSDLEPRRNRQIQCLTVFRLITSSNGVKLKSAGFNVSHEAVITQYHRNNDPSVYSHYLIKRIRSFAPGRQGVSEQEAADWADDLQKIGEGGGYFLFVVVQPLREQ
jgi:hypothetical protein